MSALEHRAVASCERGHVCLIQLQKAIEARRLKQADAARLLKVSQPRVSDLLRGRIDLFSTDMLIDMLARLGIRVRLVVRASRARRAA